MLSMRKDQINKNLMILLTVVATAALVGCGKVKSPVENAIGGAAPPDAPVITSFTYYSGGSLQSVTGGLTSSATIQPDFPSGGCAAPKTEVALYGTINPENTSSITVIGGSSPTVQITGSQFEIKVCLAQGATSLSLKSVSSSGASSTEATYASFQIPMTLESVASDHPRYPNPGFKMGHKSQTILNSYSGDVVLSGADFAEITAETVSSTGATGLTLSMGFVSMMPTEAQ